MESGIAQSIVHAMLDRFGLVAKTVETVATDDGGLLRIESAGGAHFLKLDPAATEAAVRSQLLFMDHLRRSGLPVVETMPARDGEPFGRVEGTYGVLSREIDGVCLEGTTDPVAIERCGELLGRLHESSSRFEPPAGFDRPRWDGVFAPAAGSWLDDFIERRLVDEVAVETLRAAAAHARASAEAMGDGPDAFGLIHADFHPSNLIDDGTSIRIIDFDDCGWGHWLSDLAWPPALVGKKQGPALDFSGPFRRGYERVRPLGDAARRHLSGFEIGARLACLEMVWSSSVDEEGELARGWYEYVLRSLRESRSAERGPDPRRAGHP